MRTYLAQLGLIVVLLFISLYNTVKDNLRKDKSKINIPQIWGAGKKGVLSENGHIGNGHI
jgi:hypothetical protein